MVDLLYLYVTDGEEFMQIDQDIKLDFKDVLIKPKRSVLVSRSKVKLTRQFTFKHSNHKYEGIPIIAANMDHVGTMAMAKEFSNHNMMVALHKHYSLDDLVDFWRTNENVFYSLGLTDADLLKLDNCVHTYGLTPRYICLDVANGYSEKFVAIVRQVRNMYPLSVLMAGNVVTSEMTEALILAGADIVKVGIGPGSVCTTRLKTGVGYPQLSAVIECADAAHGLGGHICSDGGCTVPGDLAKAFGAGADFVMLGGMFAGHDECDGEIVPTSDLDVFNLDTLKSEPGQKRMKFYGMSSKEAMDKYSGGMAEYRASEGKCVEVPYRGPVKNTVLDILGGLRSACTYTGSLKLKELSKRTTFIRVTQQENLIYGKE